MKIPKFPPLSFFFSLSLSPLSLSRSTNNNRNYTVPVNTEFLCSRIGVRTEATISSGTRDVVGFRHKTMNRVYLKIDGSVTSARDLPERLNEPPCSPGRRVRKRAKGKRDEGTSGLPIKFSAPCPVNTIRFRRDWNTKNGAADVRSVIPCKLFYFWIFFFSSNFLRFGTTIFLSFFLLFFFARWFTLKWSNDEWLKLFFFFFFQYSDTYQQFVQGEVRRPANRERWNLISPNISGINKRERRF